MIKDQRVYTAPLNSNDEMNYVFGMIDVLSNEGVPMERIVVRLTTKSKTVDELSFVDPEPKKAGLIITP